MAYRPEKLAHELRNEISVIMARELHDPRVGFATVTGVRVSRDLRHVRVFVSVLDQTEEKKKQTVATLNRAAGFFRREVFSRLRLRHSPEIVFTLDEAVERGDRMSQLLAQIGRELPPPNSAETATAETDPDTESVNSEPARHVSDLDDQPPRLSDFPPEQPEQR